MRNAETPNNIDLSAEPSSDGIVDAQEGKEGAEVDWDARMNEELGKGLNKELDREQGRERAASNFTKFLGLLMRRPPAATGEGTGG
jgi:hypothetical protein